MFNIIASSYFVKIWIIFLKNWIFHICIHIVYALFMY